MLRSKVISRVMSKSLEDNEAGIAGKSFPHCAALMILLDRRDFNVG